MNSNQYPAQEQAQYSDEIDLVALCAKIWAGKWKIIAASIACLALAIVYLVVTPKSYLLETVIAPPIASDLEPIQPPEANGRYTLSKITAGNAFELVKGYLQSENRRQAFWVNYHNLPSEEISSESLESFLVFNDGLTIKPGKKEDVTVAVSLMSKAPDEEIQLISSFLKAINSQVVNELLSRMNQVLAIQKSKLLEDIERAKEKYRVQLQDDIIKLEEALTIARQMSIEDTPYKQLANIEVSVVNNRFLLGTKTLSSQLEALKQRQGKDAFVPGLRALQDQMDLVEADLARLKKHRSDANTFQVLKPLSRPLKEESPKKALVLVLSLVLGGFLGLVWIMISGLSQAIRERGFEAA
ncbi:Wzz/FepE/Etk N-terminal domain-containing protein [Porticoccus sp. W117]|uniref:Wzz/FepE/Etk N-terminal domain-containing protein n=1 Tax=Porticoccus sp. W117 TaxID=3054777 RepID=UPI0025982139|nr:Wzz/FepE/Etk N-terminal domain-containing protein [Porticoccus sp. W117]MDM3872369.1 Wzz/FepE/Etk N-terminal domain-containing protein [Porticoccus sp. W117]